MSASINADAQALLIPHHIPAAATSSSSSSSYMITSGPSSSASAPSLPTLQQPRRPQRQHQSQVITSNPYYNGKAASRSRLRRCCGCCCSPAAPCFSLCCLSFLALIAVSVVGVVVTSTRCGGFSDFSLTDGEQIVCVPVSTAMYGSVTVKSKPNPFSVSYLLAGTPNITVSNSTRWNKKWDEVMEPSVSDAHSMVLVQKSWVWWHISTEGLTEGDLLPWIAFGDDSTVRGWLKDRIFADPDWKSSGVEVEGNLTVDEFGIYALGYKPSPSASTPVTTRWEVRMKRAVFVTSTAIGMCREEAKCQFSVSGSDAVVVEAPSGKSVSVSIDTTFTTAFRATVFASSAAGCIVLCITACLMGCWCLNRSSKKRRSLPGGYMAVPEPPPLLDPSPLTPPVLPERTISPHLHPRSMSSTNLFSRPPSLVRHSSQFN